jgi:SepF-like predicted cell division protein (DUF552 family)
VLEDFFRLPCQPFIRIFSQRKNKYTEARFKALKAKNEYELCLEASNTTIHKYFVEDLSDLIDVSEEESVERLLTDLSPL